MNDAVNAFVARIAERFVGVELVCLFGSRARGDHHDRSDYDVAVFGDQADVVRFIAEVEDSATTLCGVNCVNMNHSIRREFAVRIHAEAIDIWNKSR